MEDAFLVFGDFIVFSDNSLTKQKVFSEIWEKGFLKQGVFSEIWDKGFLKQGVFSESWELILGS